MDHRNHILLISRRLKPMLCLTVGIHASDLQARFQPEDAKEIDQEERLNSETYNDLKSYSFPNEWQKEWLTKPIGFRVSAGSLNVNKFYYLEQIKVLATHELGGIFSFTQDRHEDFLFQSKQSEVRLGWQMSETLYGGLVGEGGYDKKFGDLGAFAGIGTPKENHAEIALYSVDHYYNEKESGPDRYATKPWTLTGRALYLDEASGTLVESKVAYDSPLKWDQPDLNSTYTYQQSSATLLACVPVNKMISLVLDSDYATKSESRSDVTQTNEKAMKRWAGRIDVSAIYNSYTGDRLQPGVAFVQRHANYNYASPTTPDLERDDRLHSPDSMRREIMPYLLARSALGKSDLSHIHFGPIWSATEIIEDNRSVFANEVKFQAAFERAWTPEVRVLLNTNWDLDNLTTDYPYRDKSFRPWDGGNLQIQATF